MILLLDTSTPTCFLTLVDGQQMHEYKWLAERNLARDLLGFLQDKLAVHGKNFHNISAIGVMKGPGSFTGLRIGLTVANTIADDQQIAIVGVEASDMWRDQAIQRLENGDDDRLVLPEYGGNANITTPRK